MISIKQLNSYEEWSFITKHENIVKIEAEPYILHTHPRLWIEVFTGGPPFTQKSLSRFPLPGFLAHVCVSGGISVSRGPQYIPTNTSFM